MHEAFCAATLTLALGTRGNRATIHEATSICEFESCMDICPSTPKPEIVTGNEYSGGGGGSMHICRRSVQLTIVSKVVGNHDEYLDIGYHNVRNA